MPQSGDILDYDDLRIVRSSIAQSVS